MKDNSDIVIEHMRPVHTADGLPDNSRASPEHDVDEYYARIIAEIPIAEFESGTGITALRDLSGRWQRGLSVKSQPPVPLLPRAVARFRSVPKGGHPTAR